MNYAILHINKIKSINHIQAINKHNTRAEIAPNVDKSRSHLNKVINYDQRNPVVGFKALIEKYNINVRKNAVIALEHVMTFSPGAISDINIKEWTQENIDFIIDIYGMENILQVALHLDESTPHLHIIITPIIEKEYRRKISHRLDASHFMDGRIKLSAMQSKYAERMSKFKLSRGMIDSKRQHESLKEYNRKAAHIVNESELTLQSILNEIEIKDSISYSDYKAHIKDLTSRLKSSIVMIKKLERENSKLKIEIERGKSD